MKQSKTDKELIDLIRNHIEQNSVGSISGPVWFTVTSVGCAEVGQWRIAHTSNAVGLQDALTKAEADLSKLYDIKP